MSQTPEVSLNTLGPKSRLSNTKLEAVTESFIEFYSQNHSKPKKFNRGWLILCPFHNDSDPSLAIYKDGTTWCFSCKKAYKLEAVLRAYGFWEGEFKGDPELKPSFTPKEEKDWIIIDQKQYFYGDGERTFIRVRIDFENTQTRQRKKAFYFYKPTIKNGKQELELVKGWVPLILYRLNELENAQEVFFVEGEKCVDALAEVGLVATTLPIGAQVKINMELYQALMPLKGKIVYILPDADKAGWQYARTIRQALANLGTQAYIVPIPKIGEKSDIADFIELQSLIGITKEEIKKIILSWVQPFKRVATLKLIPSVEARILKENLPPTPEALDKDGVIYPGVLLFAGAPKVGKTFFLLQKSFEIAERGYKVVYLALDESKETFLMKLEALGKLDGHPNLLFYTRDDALEARLPLKLNEGGLELLNEVAETYNPDLLVVDIWENIRPQVDPKEKKDPYRQDYEAISLLRTLARKIRTIIVCHHLKKAIESDPLNRALGSVGLIGATDSIVILDRKRGDARGNLLCVSRYAQEVELALEFNEGRWTVLGEAREVEIADEQRRILEAIEELGGRAMPKEIAEIMGKNPSTVRVLLSRMLKKGIVRKDTKGAYLLCKDKDNVNAINAINGVNGVNGVNDPAPAPKAFTPTMENKQGCKRLEALKNQDSKESVYTVYSVYTDYINEDQSTDPNLQASQENQEEVIVQIEDEPCPKCQSKIWKVSKETWTKGKGFGACLECQRVMWINLANAKII